ncbi:cytochrome P450 [Rhodocollybia butyracea]|uniref:Cytochrome P450 n=1 Tax=Rhodocollybia butyracea TaxID=206335 RepID=A0A9P5PYC5_9AGAR|nr:cytochrome P450 [Rhodocollybia butyracea]
MNPIFVYAALSYLFGTALYRRFFHPLHKYPGPMLAAITDWYEAYYNIVKGGGLVAELERLHKLHGEIGPNTLHFNDRQAYHDIYTFGSTLVKDNGFYEGLNAHAPQACFSFCDPKAAKKRRGLLQPLFSRRGVMDLEYVIQKKVDRLIGILEKKYDSPDATVSMSVAYNALTTDIITSYCFAESANTLDTPNFAHPMLIGIQNTFKSLWLQRHFPFLVSLAISAPQHIILWLLPTFRGYVEMKAGYEHQVDRLIKDPGVLDTVEHETVFHHLLAPKNQQRPSRTSLVHEAFVLVAAGSDTVGSVCTIGTFYALRLPYIRKKLLDELESAWPDKDQPMSYSALEKLPYLTAFVKEPLRFSIGAIHPCPRVVGEDTPKIGGLKVPPGTIVEMSTLFLHMNPDIYPEPYTFNPERWLVNDPGQIILDLAPFSKGPRICLAWCELYLIFGNILRKLNLELLITENT